MGKLQPERFEVAFFSENRLGFFSAIKSWDGLITYLLERDILFLSWRLVNIVHNVM